MTDDHTPQTMAMQQLQGSGQMSAREEIAGLIVKNIELQERIEALEAALRHVITDIEHRNITQALVTARNALAPEQDK